MTRADRTYNSRMARRLLALRAAITEQDWDNVAFHYTNVVRGVGHLVAGVQNARLPDEEVWEPLQRASAVPLSEQAQAALRGRGEDDLALSELRDTQMWKNTIYTVMVTRSGNGAVRELSIRRNDRQPVHDWRHFQMIKTQIAGPDVEALEIYPAESRLMDTANQYYLFCLPAGEQLPMGYCGPRLLIDAHEQGHTGAVQRALPEGWVSTFTDIYPA